MRDTLIGYVVLYPKYILLYLIKIGQPSTSVADTQGTDLSVEVNIIFFENIYLISRKMFFSSLRRGDFTLI